MNPQTFEILKNFGLLLEFITAVVATIYYYKYAKTPFALFTLLLWYTFFNEITSLILRVYYDVNNTTIIYNIYQFIRTIIILYIFLKYTNTIKQQKITALFICIYILSFFINLFFQDFTKEYFSNTFIIGGSFIAIAAIIYLFTIINTDKILKITDSMMFWLSFACLIYYVPNVPFYIVRKYYSSFNSIPDIFLINFILVYIFYAVLITGFIWSKKEIKD